MNSSCRISPGWTGGRCLVMVGPLMVVHDPPPAWGAAFPRASGILLPMATTLRIEASGPRADVVLARPDVRNAFNEVVIRELREAFDALGADPAVRVVVLRGEGKVFSAGADVDWMRRMAGLSKEENRKDAEAMSAMFRAIADCPKYVIARVHGAALGGGSGLTAAADAAVAAADTVF